MQEKGAGNQLLASLSLKTEGEFSLLLKQSTLDPSHFFIGNTDQTMSVIGVQKNQSGFVLKEKVSFNQDQRHSQKIEDACFHSLEKDSQIYPILLTVSEDASLRVWDLQSGECVKVFTAAGSLYSVAARESIVLCGSFQKIFTWNLIKMKEGNNFKDHSDDVTGLCFAENFSPKYVLSCSEDELLCLRDLSLPRNDALLVTVPTQHPLLSCGFIDQTGIQEEKGIIWALTTTNAILIYDLDTCEELKAIHAQEVSTSMKFQLQPDSYCIGGLQKIDDNFLFTIASKEAPKLFIYELKCSPGPSFSVLQRGVIRYFENQLVRNAKWLNSTLLCLLTTESGKIQLYQGIETVVSHQEVKQGEVKKVSLQGSMEEDFLIIEDEQVLEEGLEKKKQKTGGLRGYRPY